MVRSAEELSIGRLLVEPGAYRASLDGAPLPLSAAQLEMLSFLLRNSERVVSREELAAAAGLERGRSVDVTLSALRRVLGQDSIRNVRNRGWIIEPRYFED